MDAGGIKQDGSIGLNVRQLMGKQSVRATFRLSEQMIELLKVAANHLEVQQKSLIDELVQGRTTLDRVASESKHAKQEVIERRQKTFVLSRSSLDLLDDISEKYDLSRDYLVELCISRLKPFVHTEQEKHKQRRQLLKEVEYYLEEGQKLLEKADQMLGTDDRFRNKLAEIVEGTEREISEMRKLVKKKQTLMY